VESPFQKRSAEGSSINEAGFGEYAGTAGSGEFSPVWIGERVCRRLVEVNHFALLSKNRDFNLSCGTENALLPRADGRNQEKPAMVAGR
jgi:hypothetical protein